MRVKIMHCIKVTSKGRRWIAQCFALEKKIGVLMLVMEFINPQVKLISLGYH